MKHCTFRTQPSKFFPKKTRSEKISYIFLYFPKWNPALFSLSSISKKNPPGENFLYFTKQKPRKKFFLSGNKTFLYLRKRILSIFQETELSYISDRYIQNLTIFRTTFKPVYRGHLRFLKKVSAITRCPLHRSFEVISREVNFAKFACLGQFWDLFLAKIIVKLLIQEIREIIDDSLNREM